MTNMPNGAWYLLIAGLVVVLGLAIWFGRGIKIRKGAITVAPARHLARTGVNVATNARVEGSVIGDITGVSTTGAGEQQSSTMPVDVLTDGVVKGSRIGDVAGIRQDERTGGR
jgi:hypothetical protein